MTRKSTPPGKVFQNTTSDPVEASNIGNPDPVHPDVMPKGDTNPKDVERSQAEALRNLAENRGQKIATLEKERDELVRDVDPHAQALASHGDASRVQVVSIEMQTAPEHALIMKVLGSEEDLLALKRGLQAATRTNEGSSEALPGEVSKLLASMPAH